MLYYPGDPASQFWNFTFVGRRGRILTVQQEIALAKKGRGSGGDGYAGGYGGE